MRKIIATCCLVFFVLNAGSAAAQYGGVEEYQPDEGAQYQPDEGAQYQPDEGAQYQPDEEAQYQPDEGGGYYGD